MRRRFRSRDVRGMEVIDATGRVIGTVADTCPLDGGGEPELALVRVGRRFPTLRYLPLRSGVVEDGRMRVPWTKWQIDDAPSAEDNRWGRPQDIAMAYWVLADD
jgi:sporulation protein YlmC with PRC-barrel domain